MKSSLPRVALLSLTLGFCTAGYTQEGVPIEFYRPLKNSVSIGVRVIGGDAKVNFSNLGNIAPRFSSPGSEAGTKGYDNGVVYADSLRVAEINNANDTGKDTDPLTKYVSTTVTKADADANGKIFTTTTTKTRVGLGGGRYQVVQNVKVQDTTDTTAAPIDVSSTQTILEDDISYDSNYTRSWAYNSAEQADAGAGTVDMSIYSVTPSSAEAQAESEKTPGVELQFAHVIKRYKRFEWGLNFSAGASNINAKTRQQIRANLVTTTDRYSLRAGSSPLTPTDGYSSDSDLTTITATSVVTGSATAADYQYGYENDHALGTGFTRIRDGEVTQDGALVSGYWQIKGAYYMLRFGPVVRVPIAKKWTVSASVGGAAAFVGSRFIADEYIELDDVVGILRTQASNDKKKFVGGYYGDFNVERWLTVRTGFFAGYSIEHLGKYTHELNGRKADVDLGNSTGFRFGIITRF